MRVVITNGLKLSKNCIFEAILEYIHEVNDNGPHLFRGIMSGYLLANSAERKSNELVKKHLKEEL